MDKFNTIIWSKEEYNYSLAFGFVPNLTFYIHKESKKRPFIIIAPGGGYGAVSPTESEMVAEVFFNRGFNVGVLCYTTNVLTLEPLKKQPMMDLGRAIRYVRKNKNMLNLLDDIVIICGFSAGGHLCGTLAVHHKDIKDENPLYKEISAKPSATVLCYPVITSSEFAHKDSFRALLGQDVYEDINLAKELEYFSLEKNVKEDTTPCFIWHTSTDVAVPVENSYLFAEALQKQKIGYAMHIFSEGRHGISLANERWAKGNFGNKYTLYQTFSALKAVKNGEIEMSEEDIKKTLEKYAWVFAKGEKRAEKPSKEVEIWPSLVINWLVNILNISEL